MNLPKVGSYTECVVKSISLIERKSWGEDILAKKEVKKPRLAKYGETKHRDEAKEIRMFKMMRIRLVYCRIFTEDVDSRTFQ